MNSKIYHGESANWVAMLYPQLFKKLIRWEKCQKNMIEKMAKR